MIKKFTLSILLIAIATTLHAQEAKKEAETAKTKMDVFSSKTGVITKFIDYKLPGIKTTYGATSETRIRKINSGNGPAFYFYQIVKEGKYSNSTASIEYGDLVELIKALKSLKADVDKDVANNPDYLENKFITVDGFQVGYYVSKAKTSWYLKLEKYGTDSSIFIDSSDTIETALNEAKAKIDSLKL